MKNGYNAQRVKGQLRQNCISLHTQDFLFLLYTTRGRSLTTLFGFGTKTDRSCPFFTSVMKLSLTTNFS